MTTLRAILLGLLLAFFTTPPVYAARDTAGTNSQISGALQTLMAGRTTATLAGWMRRTSSGSLQCFGFAETNTDRFQIQHWTDNVIYLTMGSSIWGSISKNVTGWHHCALVFDGSQGTNAARQVFYFDGVAQTLSFTGTIPAVISAGLGTFRIGRDATNNVWSTGGFAEIGLWQAILTADEVKALAAGFTPPHVRPQSLVSYMPLISNVQDIASNTALTDVSTTATAHPPVRQ